MVSFRLYVSYAYAMQCQQCSAALAQHMLATSQCCGYPRFICNMHIPISLCYLLSSDMRNHENWNKDSRNERARAENGMYCGAGKSIHVQ